MKKGKSKIGIFWIYEGVVLACPIEITEGESQGDYIDSPDRHVDAWDDPDGFSRDHPELAEMPYEAVPRGRVLYEPGADRFVIYLDESLMNEKDETNLKQAFGLTDKNCLFKSDPHYCTDADAIRRMFE